MFPEPMTLQEVAETIHARIEGEASPVLKALAGMQEAGAGDLTFASDGKHAAKLGSCQADAAIVPDGVEIPETPMALLRVPDVQLALITLLRHIAPPEDLPPRGTDPSAIVAPDAVIADSASIGPAVRIGPGAHVGDSAVLCAGVCLGAGSRVGAECVLFEGVVIRHGCVVGNRVRIGPNSVIGHDGFGYHFADGAHHKVPHIGNVVIEDDVEIGANSCVDRAKWGTTRIGEGSKIDNLVQVAHNVQVGRGAVLVAQVGVAGSTKLGSYVVLGGHVGIRDNIEIGDATEVGACSCVAQSVGPKETLFGIPAKDARTRLRELQALSRLPDLLKRVKTLEQAQAKNPADGESEKPR